MTEFMEPEDVAGSTVVAAEVVEHLDRIQKLVEAGFDEILLHNVHWDQEAFIGDFGSRALAELER